MMLSICKKLQNLYCEEKNGDGLRLQQNCNLNFKIHKKSTPDTPVMETTVNCQNTTALVDLALIAVCAAAALLALGVLKRVLKLLFR